MLTTLTRKLCPLMSLAIATIGCGKKVNDTGGKPTRNTENQELPSAYVIRLDGSQASRKNTKMIEDAQFKVPDAVIVRSGSSAGKSVEVAYNVNEFDSEDFDFKCMYVPSGTPSRLSLTKCVDYDGEDLGDVSNETFRLYKNDIIQMRFTGAPASDLVVEAIYTMKWI